MILPGQGELSVSNWYICKSSNHIHYQSMLPVSMMYKHVILIQGQGGQLVVIDV